MGATYNFPLQVARHMEPSSKLNYAEKKMICLSN